MVLLFSRNISSTVSVCKEFSKAIGVKKAHIAVSLILLVAVIRRQIVVRYSLEV